MESASIPVPAPRRRPRARAPRAARGPPELADRPPDARHPALHRLGDHAVRGVLRLVLLPPRRRQRGPVAAGGLRAPGRGRRRQHGDPGLLQLHGPLGARSRSAAATAAACRWAWRSPGCSARPSSSSRSTSTSTSASAPATAPSARSSTASPACTAPTSSSAWCCSAFANIRAWRGHFGPEAEGPPRRRGAGHLLALRRRDVDHRLHDRLHPLETA